VRDRESSKGNVLDRHLFGKDNFPRLGSKDAIWFPYSIDFNLPFARLVKEKRSEKQGVVQYNLVHTRSGRGRGNMPMPISFGKVVWAP
jgi:hypothetical protein